MLVVTGARISASHTHAQLVPCPLRAQLAHLPLCSPACKPVFGRRSAPSQYRGKVRQRRGALANVWGPLRLEDIEDVESRATEVCLLFSATPPDSFMPCMLLRLTSSKPCRDLASSLLLRKSRRLPRGGKTRYMQPFAGQLITSAKQWHCAACPIA